MERDALTGSEESRKFRTRWRVVGRFKRLARPTPTIIVSCINRNAGMDVQSRVIRLDGKGSRGVALTLLLFAHFCLPPKNGKRVYEKIWIANERVKVITAAIVGLLPLPPRDSSVLFDPLLAIKGRAKVEIEIRNRWSSLGNSSTVAFVFRDFDRS